MTFVKEKELLVRCVKSDYGQVKIDDILQEISLGQIPFFAEVQDKESEKWLPLSSHKDLSQKVVQSLKSPEQFNHQTIYNNWFVKSDDHRFGPFSLIQMIELYQQNNLRVDSLIRHPNLKQWEALVDVTPFDDRSVRALFRYPGMGEVFTRRKSPRIQYANDVCISVEGHLYSGTSLSLSKMGIGVVVEDQTEMRVSDKLNLLINPNSEHGTVQSKCEVVSLTRSMGKDRVGLVFAQEIDSLTEYIERRIPLL